MLINTSYDKDFEASFNRLSEKYGIEFTKMLGVDAETLDRSKYFTKYTKGGRQAQEELTVNPTANITRSDIIATSRNVNDPHDKLFSMHKMYIEIRKKYGKRDADMWLEYIFNGTLYLHDFPSTTSKPYCFANSLKLVAENGMYFLDQFPTGPAKHLDTFCHHVLETISWLSNRQAGAVGLPDLIVYLYYFWNKDIEENRWGLGTDAKSAKEYALQNIQSMIFDLNQPYLRIVESAFTNVTIMDENYLIAFFGDKDFPDGTPMMDKIDEIKNFQLWFLEILEETRKTHEFTFPVLTYSLLYQDNKFVDADFARKCSDINCEWLDGNFFTGGDVTSLSSCCRLVNNYEKLNGHMNSIGGTDLDIGSCKVSTINLRRIALEVGKDGYIDRLKELLSINMHALDVQRHIIQRNIEKGLLPQFNAGLLKFNRMYSTIGITGVYEALDELGLIETDEFGYKRYSKEADDFACLILDTINEIKDEFTSDKDYAMNVEAIPAESAAVKLAKADKLLFPNCKDVHILGNQWIPLSQNCTMQEKLRLGKMLDDKCGGGQIAHINIAGKFSSSDQAWEMLNACARDGGQYFCFNPIIRGCENNHHWIGSKNCPHCGGKTVEEVTRIVGFLRPVSSFSKERKEEYKLRTWYNVD